MPSAPTLNRPPRQDPQRSTGIEKGLKFGSSFARPPGPQQQPNAFDKKDLFRAATQRYQPRLRTGPTPGPQTPIGSQDQFRDKPPLPGQDTPTRGMNPVVRPTQPKITPFGPAPAPGSVKSGGLRTGPTPGPAQPPPGAPDPGTPNTTFAIPPVPADENAKADAATGYTNATTDASNSMQQAAMGYGDPALMQLWGLPAGTVNPNSALAIAALAAQLNQRKAEDSRERAGTFFSSLMGNDLSQIGATQQRADLAGYQKYQNALGRYNIAMRNAAEARDKIIRDANLDERQTAINNLPNANTTASGGFQGGTTNVTSKVPVKASSGTPKTGKTPTLKGPKGNKVKGGKAGKTRVTSNTPKSSSKVKTGVRRISGGKARG